MKIFLILLVFIGLASCTNGPEPAKPVTVEVPDSDINTVDKNDSTYLRIGVIEQGYELSILDKHLKTDNTDSVDQFITDNSRSLNKQKIILQGVDTSKFAKLLPILRKHNIFKFRRETTAG